jgi:hypothetical protein
MLALLTAEYECVGHERQKVALFAALFAENEPAAQSAHMVDPELVLAVPLEHEVHGADPLSALYFPGTQATQAPFDPDQPVLHTQSAIARLPGPAVSEFGGHGLHWRSPCVEYEPERHKIQFVRSSAESEPAEQLPHPSVDKLTDCENFPAAQKVHACEPFSALYFPGTQPLQ